MLDYLINELAVDGVARDKDKMSSVHAATQGNHPTTVKVSLYMQQKGLTTVVLPVHEAPSHISHTLTFHTCSGW